MIASQVTSTRAFDATPLIQPQRSAVQALILLGGVLRPTPFHAAIGRSVLDLPVTSGQSILQLWHEHALALARALGNPGLGVRLLLNAEAPKPRTGWAGGAVGLQIERDPAELRGTGGVVRDVACAYEKDARLLVASAAQILLEPAQNIALALVRTGADAALAACQDGTPGNLMMVRCRCMHLIPAVGYMDMKEQALPLIAKRHSVKLLLLTRPAGLSLLKCSDYLGALRRYHLREARSAAQGVFAEDWQSCFSIIEDGATVERGARVHDSVVLRGAVVGRSAVVARSLICPGAQVAPGQTVVDQLVVPAKGWAGR